MLENNILSIVWWTYGSFRLTKAEKRGSSKVAGVTRGHSEDRGSTRLVPRVAGEWQRTGAPWRLVGGSVWSRRWVLRHRTGVAPGFPWRKRRLPAETWLLLQASKTWREVAARSA